MSNTAFVVSNFGFKVIEFSSEFDKMMEKQGYEDPQWRRTQLAQERFKNFNKNMLTDPRQKMVIKPLPVEINENQQTVLTPGKKYISDKDYADKKDEYVIIKLYETFGMTDELKKRIDFENREYMYSKLKPCLAGDMQCSMLCPEFPCYE